MSPGNSKKATSKKNKKPSEDTPGNAEAKETNKAAHDQADEDIQQDADLSIHHENDDLDEAESARLGDDRNDMI